MNNIKKTIFPLFIPLENILWLTTGLSQILRTRGLILRVSFLTGFILVVTLPKLLVAQELDQQRRIEEESRKILQETEMKIFEGEDRLTIDYGGWLSTRYDHYKNDDNDSSTRDSLRYTTTADFRLWTKVSFGSSYDSPDQNQHSLYVRLKNKTYFVRRPEDTNETFDNNGPHLDYAYTIFNFQPWSIEMGRRYFNVGQGITHGNVNDGAEVSFSPAYWLLRTYFSHTLPHESNVDTSVPGGSKKSDRYFYAAEAKYLGISDQGIYTYFLIQKDQSDEDPMDATNDYTYDSQYTALGVQGKLIPQAHYWIEGIHQTGTSRVYTTNEKKDINAWAIDSGITYDLDIYSKPNFTVEYAFGSGDSDRTSVTDTSGGNLFKKDTNFLYFGYLPMGYAFSPTLSNLQFYKASVSLKPFEKTKMFKNFSLGVDYYQYYKNKKSGGIYDTEATESKKDIGYEIDFTVSWKILSDTTLSFEYGHFKPGDAFPSNTNDSDIYLSTDIRITF